MHSNSWYSNYCANSIYPVNRVLLLHAAACDRRRGVLACCAGHCPIGCGPAWEGGWVRQAPKAGGGDCAGSPLRPGLAGIRSRQVALVCLAAPVVPALRVQPRPARADLARLWSGGDGLRVGRCGAAAGLQQADGKPRGTARLRGPSGRRPRRFPSVRGAAACFHACCRCVKAARTYGALLRRGERNRA